MTSHLKLTELNNKFQAAEFFLRHKQVLS